MQFHVYIYLLNYYYYSMTMVLLLIIATDNYSQTSITRIHQDLGK